MHSEESMVLLQVVSSGVRRLFYSSGWSTTSNTLQQAFAAFICASRREQLCPAWASARRRGVGPKANFTELKAHTSQQQQQHTKATGPAKPILL